MTEYTPADAALETAEDRCSALEDECHRLRLRAELAEGEVVQLRHDLANAQTATKLAIAIIDLRDGQ
ncbi:MAG: hypothetical protein WCS88_03905 [Patescibacteria group bacterium]|jgi:predicted  nucleic acid-binding Zn-ribbon protein